MEDKKSDNVIGIIYGSQEPDRYVLFGNHRDAWGYGAIDASSGHGHLLRTAHKLSATKIEHSHWSTGHSTHL